MNILKKHQKIQKNKKLLILKHKTKPNFKSTNIKRDKHIKIFIF